MCELFLNRIEDPVPVIHSNLPKIFLHTFGKSNFEHAYIFAYAMPLDNVQPFARGRRRVGKTVFVDGGKTYRDDIRRPVPMVLTRE